MVQDEALYAQRSKTGLGNLHPSICARDMRTRTIQAQSLRADAEVLETLIMKVSASAQYLLLLLLALIAMTPRARQKLPKRRCLANQHPVDCNLIHLALPILAGLMLRHAAHPQQTQPFSPDPNC